MPRARTTRRGRLARWALAAALLAMLTLMSRPWLERRLFYFPGRDTPPPPPGVESVSFKSTDGHTLHGWWITPPGRAPGAPPLPAIVHAHGNAGHVANHAPFSAFLAEAGFGVLVFDYRGYGLSDGGPADLHRQGLVADTIAAVRYLRAREDVDPARVGLLGQSLGASFAAAAAAELGDVPALALVSGFAAWKGIARDHAGALGALLVRPGVDAAESLARLGETRLLIVHGDADRIVPVHHAQRLADAARAAGLEPRVVLLPGAGHNDLPEMHPVWTGAMRGFFDEALRAPAMQSAPTRSAGADERGPESEPDLLDLEASDE